MMASEVVENSPTKCLHKETPKRTYLDISSSFPWKLENARDDSGYLTTSPESAKLSLSSKIGTGSKSCRFSPSLKRAIKVQDSREEPLYTPVLVVEHSDESCRAVVKEETECKDHVLCPARKRAIERSRKQLDLSGISGSEDSVDALRRQKNCTVVSESQHLFQKYDVPSGKPIYRSESANQLYSPKPMLKSRLTRSLDECSSSGLSQLNSASCSNSLSDLHFPTSERSFSDDKIFSFPINLRTTENQKRKHFTPVSSGQRKSFSRSSPRYSLEGREYVDFLWYLTERSDFWPVVSCILRYLDDEDLRRICVVSRTWNRVCQMDSKANERRLKYVQQICCNKENEMLHIRIKKNSDGKPGHRRRSTLFELNNYQESEGTNESVRQTQSTSSPTKARFQLFVQEGRKLENGKSLQQCPRCTYPSHIDESIKQGRCTRLSCGFEFCARCRCELHDKRPCSVSLPGRSRQGSVGSKQSRKNLRRL